MFGVVYRVHCISTEKNYIGQTTKSLKERMKQHLKDMKQRYSYFYSALRLYGEGGFFWEIIDQAETKKELNEKEIYWIKKYDSTNREKGYNLTEGGKGGPQTNSEVLKKMGDAFRGRSLSEETKRKISIASKESKIGKLNPMYGKVPWNKGKKFGPLSDEQKWFISQLHKGRKRPKETGEKISQSLRGRSLSKEHKDRIREVRLGTKASEGTKRKMSESANNKRSIICTETGKVYESVNMASRLMGIGDTNIRQCAKGIQYTAGGYHWQYVT